MAGVKSNAVEVAARVDTVVSLLLRGKSRPDVIQYAAETWQVGERMADNYIAKANELIREITQPRKEYEYGLVRSRLEDLYKKTLEDKNYNTALAVLKQVAEMTGINEPTKIDIEVNDLTDAQSRLAHLVSGHAAARKADGVANEPD